MARFNDGFAANHFTSACGTMIYRDDLLGPAYAGNAFICEPVHNLVHRAVLRPAGATFRSERAPEDAAAVAASDALEHRLGPEAEGCKAQQLEAAAAEVTGFAVPVV